MESKRKKIWFTELGFPSVDLCSNQPNVFYSPESIESKFPIHSKGKVDFASQRQALSASEKFLSKCEFLERSFIWTWDARPYPYWPDLLSIWSDGGSWSRGHWVNGKLGKVTLSAIIKDISAKIGLTYEDISSEQLTDVIDGLVIADFESAADIINILKKAYSFISFEADGKVNFPKKLYTPEYEIKHDDILTGEHNFKIYSKEYSDIANLFELNYFNYFNDYNLAVEVATNPILKNKQKEKLYLPLIIDPLRAKIIAQTQLNEIFYSRQKLEFKLCSNYLSLKPGDKINFKYEGRKIALQVDKTYLIEEKIVKLETSMINSNKCNYNSSINENAESILINKDLYDPDYSEIIFINAPRLPYQSFDGILIGVIGKDQHWRGATVICPDNSLLNFEQAPTYGLIEARDAKSIIVQIFNGELESLSENDNKMANLAFIEGEVIQYRKAEFLGESKYKLTQISEPLFSSEASKGKRFIVLDNKLQKFPLDTKHSHTKHEFYVISNGHSFDQKVKFEFVT